ncbi:vacuolar protein sorting-associated protein 26A-like [Hibiscus syriacus]|uniref:Vacuolar protein sorting-associated protein 26A-like n=1 Tax=Hibiscus syriacus TaxID=106335 RepID=A0A6A3CZA2_HIBSY|nr:vacuolar protein sorting-associated protein 26A-like [Hibiscus syriacus]
MAPPSLLGPPEFRNPPPLESQTQTDAATTGPSDRFMDAMVANFNKAMNSPPMGFTENMSAAYPSTGNPCLDFFFHVVPDSPPASIREAGAGKSDKESVYTAAFLLHDHHPKTLACNLDSLVNLGYFKDIPEILYRMLEGPTVRKIQKEEWTRRKMGLKCKRRRGVSHSKKPGRKKMENNKVIMNPKKFLYECVPDVFAACLKADIEFMKSNEPRKIGLAAKWCASIDSSFDRSTLLCESIVKKVFPREDYPEYNGVEEEHYAYRVRDRLRKQVLVPLRKLLELPEVYIGANKWGSIPYNRIASVAMKLYKDKFLKHDKEPPT